MKKSFLKALLLFFLCTLILAPTAHAQEQLVSPPFYTLRDIFEVRENEEAHFALETSYYSGELVYKGATDAPLTGACVLHCSAVVMSNRFGYAVPVQEVAKANNKTIRKAKNWTAFVTWGRLESSFQVRFSPSYNMAQFLSRQKANGVKLAQRRQAAMEEIVSALHLYADNTGLIIHFNSTGTSNGSGKRHAVVVMGYILENGVVSDLIVNDSSLEAPLGVAVRLSESSVPLSMLREKGLEQADKETLAMQMMDYLVSYRYLERD